MPCFLVPARINFSNPSKFTPSARKETPRDRPASEHGRTSSAHCRNLNSVSKPLLGPFRWFRAPLKGTVGSYKAPLKDLIPIYVTILELGLQNHSEDSLSGPTSIIALCGPLGT